MSVRDQWIDDQRNLRLLAVLDGLQYAERYGKSANIGKEVSGHYFRDWPSADAYDKGFRGPLNTRYAAGDAALEFECGL